MQHLRTLSSGEVRFCGSFLVIFWTEPNPESNSYPPKLPCLVIPQWRRRVGNTQCLRQPQRGKLPWREKCSLHGENWATFSAISWIFYEPILIEIKAVRSRSNGVANTNAKWPKWQRESRNNSTRKVDNINIHHNSPRTGREVCKIWWLTGTGKHDAPPHASFLAPPSHCHLPILLVPEAFEIFWEFAYLQHARADTLPTRSNINILYTYIYRAYIKYLYSSVCTNA